MTFDEQLLALGGDIVHHFGGGVYAKQMLIRAGCSMGKHVHDFDHLSILGSGQAQLKVDGVLQSITGPLCITVQAGKVHEVHAVTDIVWFCVHKTDETDPEKVDHTLIEGS